MANLETDGSHLARETQMRSGKNEDETILIRSGLQQLHSQIETKTSSIKRIYVSLVTLIEVREMN